MRTKKQIVDDYKDFLISQKFDCKGFSDDILLEMLMTALYETEEYKGQTISTTKAFWHFCKFVINRRDNFKSPPDTLLVYSFGVSAL